MSWPIFSYGKVNIAFSYTLFQSPFTQLWDWIGELSPGQSSPVVPISRGGSPTGMSFQVSVAADGTLSLDFVSGSYTSGVISSWYLSVLPQFDVSTLQFGAENITPYYTTSPGSAPELYYQLARGTLQTALGTIGSKDVILPSAGDADAFQGFSNLPTGTIHGPLTSPLMSYRPVVENIAPPSPGGTASYPQNLLVAFPAGCIPLCDGAIFTPARVFEITKR